MHIRNRGMFDFMMDKIELQVEPYFTASDPEEPIITEISVTIQSGGKSVSFELTRGRSYYEM